MTPSLSVILPNYNHGHLIVEALEALLAQSLQPKEVLVIDDASTDDSAGVIERFAKSHPLVRFQRNERNLNVLATVNRGLAQVTGDYLYCASADDRVLPGLFMKSVELLKRNPQAGFCCARALRQGPDGKSLGLYETPAVSATAAYLSPVEVVDAYNRQGAWVVPHTVVYRRAAFAAMGGFDLALKGTADAFIYHVLSVKYGACFIPEPLALWRQSEDSYCRQSVPDVSSVLEVVGLTERLMRTTYREVFPEDYVAAMRRWSFSGALGHLNDNFPGRHDEVSRLWNALGSGALLDRIFFAAWRGYTALGRLALKLYHFLLQPCGEQKRILLGKLGL